MKRGPQLVAAFLALCLIWGGIVVGSPALHVWAEHGGQGAPHLHRCAMMVPSARGRAVFVPTRGASACRTVDFQRFTHALHHVLAGVAADAPAQKIPGHEHHSFVQLLAGGALDSAVDLAAPEPVSVSFRFYPLPPSVVVLTTAWSAQTASRGPPLRAS